MTIARTMLVKPLLSRLLLGASALLLPHVAACAVPSDGDDDIEVGDVASSLSSPRTKTWVYSDLGAVSSTDQFVQTQVSGITDKDKLAAILLRASSEDTLVAVVFSGTRFQIFTLRGGVQTTVLDQAFTSPGSGFIRVEVSGTTLRTFFNGSQMDSRTVASLSGFNGKGTGVGLYQNTASSVVLTNSSSGALSSGADAGAPSDSGSGSTTDSGTSPDAGDVLPGTGGCSCQRPGLAANAFPTATNVGACGSFKKSYSSKVTIDNAFISSNGGSKVVDSIQVSGSIEIKVPGVTLCNFKANDVKINASDVRVQDGTLVSSSSLFVNYAPSSSGLATRLYVEGGSADAIRVGVTASGKTQAVTQSYFTEIGKYRSSSAHCDLVQTYPVPGSGEYHSSLIEQNYFSSALYSGTDSGRAVNATWMTMTDGAHFEGNLVDRVFQGFWFSGSPKIDIHDNLFNSDQVDGLKYLTCDVGSAVKHTNNFWFTRKNGQIVKGAAAPTCN